MLKEDSLNKSYYCIDIVKFMLCFLVIAIHIGPLKSYSDILNYFFVEVIARIAVPFFFISSSFLMTIKNRNIKSYCLNMYFMYVIWTIIYIPLYILDFNNLTLGERIKSFLFYGTYTHLWFLLACSVAPIICQIIEKIFGDNMKYVALLFLFAIGACSQTYYWLAIELKFENMINILCLIFGSLGNGVFFAPIFFALGKRIAELDGERMNEYSVKKLVLLILICFVTLTCEAYFCWKTGKMKGFEFYFSLIPLTNYLLIFVLKLDLVAGCKKNVRFFGKLSTTVYLIHLYVKKCICVENTLLSYILCCVVSVVCGGALLMMHKKRK